jgi:Flp pilus assembly pilin Flp
MRLVLDFIQDEQSQEITKHSLFVGIVAVIGLIVLANFGHGLRGVWSHGNSYFVLSRTLG